MKTLLKLTSIFLGLLMIVLAMGSLGREGLLYRSWWFSALLGAFSLIIIGCLSLRRRKNLSYWLLHSGFILILAGGTLSNSFSFRERLQIREKEAEVIAGTNYHLRLNSFKVTYYGDKKTPKQFCSDITLLENGEELASGQIRVNHPFSFRGYKFYQADYSPVSFDLLLGLNGREFLAREIGDEFEMEDLRIKLLDFLPDFVMVEGKPTTRSPKLNNPAVKVGIYRDDKLKATDWVFLNFTDYHQKTDLRFKEIVPIEYSSGLEVVKDPGVPLTFIGFLVLILGTILKVWR